MENRPKLRHLDIEYVNKLNPRLRNLRMERWLYRISVALKHEDIRHQPLDEQAGEYAASIEALMRNR